jgi:hypothetical protein
MKNFNVETNENRDMKIYPVFFEKDFEKSLSKVIRNNQFDMIKYCNFSAVRDILCDNKENEDKIF